MAAVVFTDDLVAALTMRKFRRQLGWTDDHEYKFNKTKKDYIKQVLRLVSQYDFAIYAIVINKAKFRQTPKHLYHDSISELFKLIPLKRAAIKMTDTLVQTTPNEPSLRFVRTPTLPLVRLITSSLPTVKRTYLFN